MGCNMKIYYILRKFYLKIFFQVSKTEEKGIIINYPFCSIDDIPDNFLCCVCGKKIIKETQPIFFVEGFAHYDCYNRDSLTIFNLFKKIIIKYKNYKILKENKIYE